jgi:hypothetical protein
MKKFLYILILFIVTSFLTSCDKEYYDIDYITTVINSYNRNDSIKSNPDTTTSKTPSHATISFGVGDVESGN